MPNKTFDAFRRDTVVTTVPVNLPFGYEAYYKNPEGGLSLYVGDENGVAQLAVPSTFPSRVVNVFGGADNIAPNFDTFAGALTYANSLDPSTVEPVSIRMFAKADGTPYEITGGDDWYALCLDGIYVSSPFRDVFSTTTLPTTLAKGMKVMYVDGNGTESLWVGNADGEAWPAVGYKEYVALLEQVGENAPVPTVLLNTLGDITWSRIGEGNYNATSNALFATNKTTFVGSTIPLTSDFVGTVKFVFVIQSENVLSLFSSEDGVGGDDFVSGASVGPISIRIYH